MTGIIYKFPYDACRRVHSRKPRKSRNGTPEQRAAKAAAITKAPADGLASYVKAPSEMRHPEIVREIEAMDPTYRLHFLFLLKRQVKKDDATRQIGVES
jgi:hypothetical protein